MKPLSACYLYDSIQAIAIQGGFHEPIQQTLSLTGQAYESSGRLVLFVWADGGGQGCQRADGNADNGSLCLCAYPRGIYRRAAASRLRLPRAGQGARAGASAVFPAPRCAESRDDFLYISRNNDESPSFVGECVRTNFAGWQRFGHRTLSAPPGQAGSQP